MRLCAVFAVIALAAPLDAQLVVKLSPQTVSEFERYVQTIETQLHERWQGKKHFLLLDDDPQQKQRVLAGDVFVKQMNDGRPVSIQDGLIHDWVGAIYVPNQKAEQVVRMLEDFDKHKKIYPAVGESRLIEREGDAIKGYWQLRQKAGLVPVVLDVEEDVSYRQVAPGKWTGTAYARNIVEEDTGLFSHGKKFPLGEGHGYLWRLYSYWTLEDFESGVLAECRTLSLSRDIPEGLAWAVGPYVQKGPQDSLTSTLKATRKALEK